jgi:hypothetical protein
MAAGRRNDESRGSASPETVVAGGSASVAPGRRIPRSKPDFGAFGLPA